MTSAVVVGAGVFGTAIARRLALDGLEVTLVEQESPGWDGSSSGGESRLLRFSHGASGEWYARSARRARELWREVGDNVFTECGLVWFAHGEGGWETDSERMLRALEIPVERLEPGEAAALFPSLGVADLEWALLEPGAGVLRADRAVRALAGQALEAGARLTRGRATPVRGESAVQVAAREAGDPACALEGRIEADHVVWACGPWLASLFPELVQLRVTRQEVTFFEAPPEWRGVPGWVDYESAAYGHGDLHGDGVKIASDAEGEEVHPDRVLSDAPSHSLAEQAARDYLGRRFPALADARLVRSRACPYELTVDTHFVAAPHPEAGGVWLVGGGSGHGFKHAPVLAEHVAALIGGSAAPEPAFAARPRDPERSLRTAGVRATPLGKKLGA